MTLVNRSCYIVEIISVRCADKYFYAGKGYVAYIVAGLGVATC